MNITKIGILIAASSALVIDAVIWLGRKVILLLKRDLIFRIPSWPELQFPSFRVDSESQTKKKDDFKEISFETSPRKERLTIEDKGFNLPMQKSQQLDENLKKTEGEQGLQEQEESVSASQEFESSFLDCDNLEQRINDNKAKYKKYKREIEQEKENYRREREDFKRKIEDFEAKVEQEREDYRREREDYRQERKDFRRKIEDFEVKVEREREDYRQERKDFRRKIEDFEVKVEREREDYRREKEDYRREREDIRRKIEDFEVKVEREKEEYAGEIKSMYERLDQITAEIMRIALLDKTDTISEN